MLQKFYCFIFPFLSPLSSFFLFSSLSLSGSLSLLPVPVPFFFDQFEMFTGSNDSVALTTTARSTTLDQPRLISPTFQLRLISPTLSHARSRRSHPEAAIDLTLFPFLSFRLSLCLSLVVVIFFYFYFLLQFWLIWWWWWAVGVMACGGCRYCWWVVWVGVMVVCCGIWLDLLGFALSCVFGCGGCGGCVVVAVGCW